MRKIKCESCGARVDIDKEEVCPYCGSAINCKEEQKEVKQSTTIINYYYGNSKKSDTNDEELEDEDFDDETSDSDRELFDGPRPKFHFILFLILCCIYVFPGVIYAVATIINQQKWDEYHKK